MPLALFYPQRFTFNNIHALYEACLSKARRAKFQKEIHAQ